MFRFWGSGLGFKVVQVRTPGSADECLNILEDAKKLMGGWVVPGVLRFGPRAGVQFIKFLLSGSLAPLAHVSATEWG